MLTTIVKNLLIMGIPRWTSCLLRLSHNCDWPTTTCGRIEEVLSWKSPTRKRFCHSWQWNLPSHLSGWFTHQLSRSKLTFIFPIMIALILLPRPIHPIRLIVSGAVVKLELSAHKESTLSQSQWKPLGDTATWIGTFRHIRPFECGLSQLFCRRHPLSLSLPPS